jgi:hypothetical protein
MEAPQMTVTRGQRQNPEEGGQKSKMSIAAFLILGAVLIPLVYLGIHSSGVSADNRVKILHADCQVLEKSKIKDDLYLIKTSCGEYEAITRMAGFVEVGERYDMKVTEGNWAQNPRLKVANGSCECSSTPPKPNPPVPSKPTPIPTSPTDKVPSFVREEAKSA